jgi:nicotinamidase/pyrazinamidase
MNEPVVFFDIDTQVDFMLPTGKLYVPGAEEIVPNLKRLMAHARGQGIPVISSADAHIPDDPEFKIWPPHCVMGTPGQGRIPETRFPEAVVIPYRPGAFTPPAEWRGQYVIEKPTYDSADNPNFDAVVRSLGRRRAVVFGVATEFCVRADVLALRKRGMPVDLVIDAIRPIKEEDGRKAIEEMTAVGVQLVKTDDVLKAKAHYAS